MLTKEENEFLSRVGPGTPGGELQRRYWHPIAPTANLDENPVQRVRILCEDLILYRDRSGELGLVARRCPHRLMDMQFGIPEETGIRCPYHGWRFDGTGACLETPLEDPDSTFKERMGTIQSYPVQEMGGLIWAYLGPEPAPLLPQWDLCVRPDGSMREIIGHQLPCNWLQCAENRADLGHAIYLHGNLFRYALERTGQADSEIATFSAGSVARMEEKLRRRQFPKYESIYNELGFTKSEHSSDQPGDPNDPRYRPGINPIIFPYHLAFGPNSADQIRWWYQIGVPIDDENTWHITYYCYTFPPEIEVPKQESVPYLELPIQNEKGEYILDYILSQDMVAWYGQGPIVDRTQEHLGASDKMVIDYRQMLKEQIRIVMEGGEPMNVFRDPEKAWRPELRIPDMYHHIWQNGGEGRDALDYEASAKYDVMMSTKHPDRFFKDRDVLLDLYQKTIELSRKKREAGFVFNSDTGFNSMGGGMATPVSQAGKD
ncbi:MAG TPA: Rieske 2Fe-2S domain-containing protein [Dehalococcoidia bacterium]|nr:Rieske 2Fe-2S domain-containing protein [Dehalococcoidia bacterium]